MDIFAKTSDMEKVGFMHVLAKIEPITIFGIEEKKNLKAFVKGEEKALGDEFEKTKELIDVVGLNENFIRTLETHLHHIKDFRNSIKRAGENYALTVVELFEVKSFVGFIKKMSKEFESSNWNLPFELGLKELREIESLLDPENREVDTFYIYDAYSEQLKKVRDAKKEVAKKIKRSKKILRKEVSEKLNIKIGMDGSAVINKDDKELIEAIEASNDMAYESETYMSIKFSLKHPKDINEHLKELEDLKAMEEEEEFEVRKMLTENILKYKEIILTNMTVIGKIDFLIAKVKLAIKQNLSIPKICEEAGFELEDARHLQTEEALKEKDIEFTKLNYKANSGVTCITGANMGGKTISLKTAAQCVMLAQHGICVPAKNMKLGLFEFVSVSIGDSQSADSGLSTFGGEIQGIEEAIKLSDKRGLIVIDELASGTNPEEGHAISKAIVEYLKNKNSVSIITTHYDNIASIEGVLHLQVVGLENVDYEKLKKEMKEHKQYGVEIISCYMDYRLKPVKSRSEVPRDAINIAKLMGLDEDIIKRAERYLNQSN